MLYTVDEFAREFKVNPQTVRRWIRNGKIKSVKHGDTYRIPEDQLKLISESEEVHSEKPINRIIKPMG